MLSTKERIIFAAADLLDAGGPSAVTLRAVGDAAGISQSAPYRHFTDKRALLDTLVRHIIQQMRAVVDAARGRAGTPIAALNLVVREYYQFARRYPARYRLLLEESRSESPVGTEARQAFMTVAELVEDAQQARELKEGDPALIVAIIFGAVHGMADLEQFGLIKVDSDSDAEAALPGLLVEILARQIQTVAA
jgi:AcrR family transcriptional regulator